MPKESNVARQIQKLSNRVARLEKMFVVRLPKSVSKLQPETTTTDFRGPTGGVRLLITKSGFFKQKRQLSDVVAELANRHYHYSLQAVHEALRRLSSAQGPLVSLREGGRKVYVERK